MGGVLAAARAARYGLLEAACRGESILHLLVAHHYEDQAETVALRAARGSGAVGLAGMAAVREVHGLRVLRPLLAVPKARLMATLRQCDWPWLVDPSNAEPRFARASLRQDHDFVSEIHWRRGYDHAVARSALDRQLGDWLARNARPHALGFVRVEREAWLALAPEHRVLVLERVLLAVAGQAYPARRATLERLAGDGHWAQRSVGGCLARVAGGMLVVVREPGRIRERLMLRAGDEQLWDGRFLVRHAQGAIALEVSALGVGGVQALPGMLKRRLREAELAGGGAGRHARGSHGWRVGRMPNPAYLRLHPAAGILDHGRTATGPSFGGATIRRCECCFKTLVAYLSSGYRARSGHGKAGRLACERGA